MTIEHIIARIKAESDDITICKGVSESTLRWFEFQMRVVLPDDFKALYRFSNGFESAEDSFRILPLEEIVADRRSNHWKRLINNRFYFAEYLQYCDMWSVEMNEAHKSSYSIFCPTGNNENTVMTHSLTEFINCFLNNGVFGDGGLYDWGEAIFKNNS